MLWTEDTRHLHSAANIAPLHISPLISQTSREKWRLLVRSAAARMTDGGGCWQWLGLRHLAAANQPFTHWLGRRQIRAKYFQKVVKGSVTELSRSVDCIRCVTDLPPHRPPQHSLTIVRRDQAAKIQRALQQIMLQFVFPPHSFTLIMFLNIHFHNIYKTFIINRTILQCRDLNLMLRLSNRTNSMLNTHCKFFSHPETEGRDSAQTEILTVFLDPIGSLDFTLLINNV